ncbi:MAG: glutathione S-transferase [Paracoccaceae bacterium]|jgi:glutathione S-transferase
MSLPFLYSFRRCPYAMRARLAIQAAGVTCELREILLREKAPEFLAASEKATVPVVVTNAGNVIEQSLDVMLWALAQADPFRWLVPETGTIDQAMALIAQADADFKDNLDHYKYASRFENGEGEKARDAASGFLYGLNDRLANTENLTGGRTSLADMAIAPFVRQFANVDRAWFDQQNWPHLLAWLNRFLASTDFNAIMTKYPKWQSGDAPTNFPQEA